MPNIAKFTPTFYPTLQPKSPPECLRDEASL